MTIPKIAAVVAVALATVSGLRAETVMKVSYLDESRPVTVVKLTDASKVGFGQGSMISFTECVGAPEGIRIADVRRLTFEGSGLGVNATEKNVPLALRHNPVGDILEVTGFDNHESATLSIFTIAGREAVRINSWDGRGVDVSSLPSGIYILRINHFTTKFVKK